MVKAPAPIAPLHPLPAPRPPAAPSAPPLQPLPLRPLPTLAGHVPHPRGRTLKQLAPRFQRARPASRPAATPKPARPGPVQRATATAANVQRARAATAQLGAARAQRAAAMATPRHERDASEEAIAATLRRAPATSGIPWHRLDPNAAPAPRPPSATPSATAPATTTERRRGHLMGPHGGALAHADVPTAADETRERRDREPPRGPARPGERIMDAAAKPPRRRGPMARRRGEAPEGETPPTVAEIVKGMRGTQESGIEGEYFAPAAEAIRAQYPEGAPPPPPSQVPPEERASARSVPAMTVPAPRTTGELRYRRLLRQMAQALRVGRQREPGERRATLAETRAELEQLKREEER